MATTFLIWQVHTLDVSCNALSEESARELQEAMANNASLTSMDLRWALHIA